MIPLSNIKEIYHLLMLALSMVGLLILTYHVYLLIMNELIQKAFRAIKRVEEVIVGVNFTAVDALSKVNSLESRISALENKPAAAEEDLGDAFRLAEELGY